MILNFVLLIWEERNLGCYENARACQERARVRRARKKSTSPPTIYINCCMRKDEMFKIGLSDSGVKARYRHACMGYRLMITKIKYFA
jgi:hypothetical protein